MADSDRLTLIAAGLVFVFVHVSIVSTTATSSGTFTAAMPRIDLMLLLMSVLSSCPGCTDKQRYTKLACYPLVAQCYWFSIRPLSMSLRRSTFFILSMLTSVGDIRPMSRYPFRTPTFAPHVCSYSSRSDGTTPKPSTAGSALIKPATTSVPSASTFLGAAL